ncbi:uncharacterized protein BCR38DRAFT_511183 [Pseudomassariella vexata]|uniref:FAD-binding domain-containing protein n=1 Tax=Pseudomassariella vexata TaxID=1141098 RepID=A0A1Y2E963_9PEZI|nr:uncharacterized protein BCR38DRAFT_511183 [Pseudomassariella vexata]ORY67816.1 hypothetical protein BCR38DRAFT_511183 [Pseudomassariella vexata]
MGSNGRPSYVAPGGHLRSLAVSGRGAHDDASISAPSLWSTTREQLLSTPSPPQETGDLAYRGTFSLEQLRALNDPDIAELCSRKIISIWLGPDKHCVFYPVREGKEFNLVIARPDNMPRGTRTMQGDIQELRECFIGWDSTITKIISCLSSVSKWKLCHHYDLESWTKGSVVIIGDASHPTLPYLAQGAAMAAEDGAQLGKLLGLLQSAARSMDMAVKPLIPEALKLFEALRKSRTNTIVLGAISNREWFHVADGPKQRLRDEGMAAAMKGEEPRNKWSYHDARYQAELLGFDAVDEIEKAFGEWWEGKSTGRNGSVGN